MVTCQYGHKYENMTSSKRVPTYHHIHRFLCKYLELKIYPNAGQMPGTMYKGKREKGKREKIWPSLKGPPSECDFDFFNLSMKKNHDGV